MSGIQSYGSYVPFFRLKRADFAGGRGERAVASYDEDSISMAVAAAREALVVQDGPALDLDRALFASISPPYLEKLNCGIVHAALDLHPTVRTRDLGGSSLAGLSALADAFDLATAGQTTLVVSADVVVGAPGGPREAGGGDAASAFVIGPRDGVARLLGRASTTLEVLDVWRSAEMPFARQWEERFGAEIFGPAVEKTIRAALEEAGTTLDDIAFVALDSTNPRVDRTAAKNLGIPVEKLIAPGLAASVGRAGSAHGGLLLAHALDQAESGDKILVVVAADGVEAVVVEATEALDRGRPPHSVEQWVASKSADLPYTSYLKWRSILPSEPPRRPDPERPAAPPMQRSERWKYAFVGSRCQRCCAVNLPPQRVCVACQAVDQMEPVPCADVRCRVATYTIDRLAYSLHPPIVAAVVDFEGGGRLNCQLTDVDPEGVGMGDQLEMTFRRFFTAGGVHNYFWKARPQR